MGNTIRNYAEEQGRVMYNKSVYERQAKQATYLAQRTIEQNCYKKYGLEQYNMFMSSVEQLETPEWDPSSDWKTYDFNINNGTDWLYIVTRNGEIKQHYTPLWCKYEAHHKKIFDVFNEKPVLLKEVEQYRFAKD